jgi:hypothetical protein
MQIENFIYTIVCLHRTRTFQLYNSENEGIRIGEVRQKTDITVFRIKEIE